MPTSLCVVVGEVLSGLSVAYKINSLAVGKPDDTAGPEANVVIEDCGQIRAGRPIH